MFNEATEKNYKIPYEELYTERRLIIDMIVQADNRSAQQVSSPKNLIFALQARDSLDSPRKQKLNFIGQS